MEPHTPRKRKRWEDESVSVSPYFSPLKRCTIKAQDSLPVCEGPEQAEPDPSNDPLSLFYSRSLLRIYEELDKLRPKLIQEDVAGDKWRLLVACTLLNKTSGKLALPVFWRMIERWPTAWEMSQADEEDLVSLLLRLGTQTIRAKRLIALSKEYIKDPPSHFDDRPSRVSTLVQKTEDESKRRRLEKYPATPVSHLPGSGPYALDSYRIFCTVRDDPSSTEWQRVLPGDKELIHYLRWKWAVKEHRQWSPTDGPGPPASLAYLKSLKSDLLMTPAKSSKTLKKSRPAL